ncbi:MAG TPA: DUF2339 domain-containing protein [Flavisolibacter sp.]|jgi:uncharacterized membrane protein|nr:DUF2339 domain-containing protein [Flavisolibacter sp.]
MKEQEQITALQEEVKQLYREVKVQEGKLYELHQKLLKLQGINDTKVVIPVTPAAQNNAGFENFLGLKVIHLIGIVLLVIGLSIGVKYAIDKELISELARVGLAYAAGGVLYFLSLRLKEKYSAFSAILFSGAAASLYFTTYAAFTYYQMFSGGLAFALMIGLTAVTIYYALQYNRQEIALLGLVGAYAIPFLISQNSERADLFFLYISLINTAVIYLAFKKSWRWVGNAAAVITWVLFNGWAITETAERERPAGTLAMIYFFILFQFNAIARPMLDGKPLELHRVYEVLLHHVALYSGALILYAPAFSALEIGSVTLLYFFFVLIQAVVLHYILPNQLALKRSVGVLAIILFVVFIANRWEGVTVTLLWLATSVLLFAGGAVGKGVWLRMSAIGLMGITLLKLATVDSLRFSTLQKIVSYITLGILLLVVSFFYQKFKAKLFPADE